jgi:hypothetical protein
VLQHPVPDEHLKAIGDITVSFALLESQIQFLIGSLIFEHQRIGQIITAELSFRNLRALLISLYLERHGEDDDFKVLRELMQQAGLAEAKRNQITHSVWGAGKDKDHITRIKTTAKEKDGIKFKSEQVSAEYLDNFSKDIKALANKILQFQLNLLERNKILNNPAKKNWP